MSDPKQIRLLYRRIPLLFETIVETYQPEEQNTEMKSKVIGSHSQREKEREKMLHEDQEEM